MPANVIFLRPGGNDVEAYSPNAHGAAAVARRKAPIKA